MKKRSIIYYLFLFIISLWCANNQSLQKNHNPPNFDKLAAQGVVFTQHNSATTVCALSRAAFAPNVTLLYDQFGELFDNLKSIDISDNTIIVFTSDNGAHKEGGSNPDFFNSKFRDYKQDLLEGGINVAMIVKWPKKITSQKTTNQASAFWDIMPISKDFNF